MKAKIWTSAGVIALCLLALQGTPLGPVAARAQAYDTMSCDELWYERNSIYAAEGYCFKTARGRSVFGAGCFPPYGKLDGAENAEVALIQKWERYKGCGSAAAAPPPAPPPPAPAVDYSAMSCDDLWFSRNAIYAAEGYCFKSQRGKSAFGTVCFPPYGKLTKTEQNEVAVIQRWERSKGCP